MRTRTALATTALLAFALTACSSSEQPTDPKDADASRLSQPSPPPATVQLAWSHTSKDAAGDMQVWYVAHVKNPGKTAASVAIDARALDKTGTIVGSSQEILPNVPAGSTFDYFGILGGGLSSSLTGVPAKVEIAQAKDAIGQAGAVDNPMLATREVKLSAGNRDDLFSDAPYVYNLSVKVTNNTRGALTSGVTQQVVLYDAQGKVVGGDTGSSDNVPDNLPAGMSYREQWTGIPAMTKAARASYTVWPG